MTSRFREELARRGRRPRRGSPRRVRATVATAGRAVFFSGLTVLLGLLGLVLFEFMILRSVGIAGAMVVGLAVLAGADAAAGAPRGRRPAARSLRRPPRRRRRRGATARGRGSPARVMRRPVAVLVPTLALLLLLGVAVPARPVQRPGRHDPAAGGPVAGAFDLLAARVRRGRVRAARRSRSGRPAPATEPGQPRRALRLLAAPRRRPAGQPRRQPRRRRPAADARAVPAPVRRPVGPPDRFVATALAATTTGDLTAFTINTPFGPNRDEGARARRGRCAIRPAARATGRAHRPRGRRRGRRRRRRRPASRPTSRGRPCSSS